MNLLKKQLTSVLDQDYAKIEYIVMDGGSSDNTLSVLEKYESRIKWISQPDNGQSDAINKGWQMATGDILAWINSDDAYTPGAVNAAVKKFVEHPNVGMVYGNSYKVDINGNSN